MASRISIRNRGSMASARVKTCFMVRTGRSGESSLPAFLMVQELDLISPSSTAVAKIAFSRRYALAMVTAPMPLSRRSLRHLRM
ncbi:hypothetical protein SAMN05421874_12014 [Nonomuraea maritima]|uniref:Uncharacterized protein n=1 Tax=Nonomuraea maritima TaxID=683260 RepID=A0A1G9JD30_9ACTN|nr:hypothetical protein SAMN05421874_12014 [Nonomuraea maritima]